MADIVLNPYVPMYVPGYEAAHDKELITATDWNRLWSVIITQGNYNTDTLRAICTELINLLANITVHKTSGDHDSRYYLESEVDSFLANLKGVGYTNESLKGLHDLIINVQSQINNLDTMYSTDAERIAAIDQVVNNLNATLVLKADRTELTSIVLGQIPDYSLPDIKLSNATGQIKQVVNTLKKSNPYEGTLFKITSGASVKIGCVGDSITYGNGLATAYPTILQNHLRYLYPYNPSIVVVNDGVPGDTCALILARMSAILSAGYDTVILQVGINDTGDYVSEPGFTVETYKAQYTEIIQMLKNNNIGVLVLTPLAGAGGGINELERATDIACRQVCAKEGVPYVDLRKLHDEILQSGFLTPTELSWDYVHWNDQHYQYIADTILRDMFFIPTVKDGEVIPIVGNTAAHTWLTTYATDVAMKFGKALVMNTTAPEGTPHNANYLLVPIFVTEKYMQACITINKTSTSGTAIAVYVNDVAYGVNAYSGTTVYDSDEVIMTGTFKYGLNWLSINGVNNNGKIEIQAFKIFKNKPEYYGKELMGIAHDATTLILTGIRLDRTLPIPRTISLEKTSFTMNTVPIGNDVVYNNIVLQTPSVPAGDTGIAVCNLGGFTGLTQGLHYAIKTNNVLKIT